MKANNEPQWPPFVALYLLGMASSPALPMWLPVAGKRFALDPLQAGMIGSLELGCIAIATIAWAVFSRVERGRGWLWGAILTGLVGNLLSFATENVVHFVTARAAVGLCGGLALAEITRRAALTANPHRIFAVQQFGLAGYLALFFSTMPKAIDAYGAFAPFLYGAALCCLALVCLLWLPRSTRAEAGLSEHAGSVESAPASPAALLVALIFSGVTLTFVAQGTIWPYVTEAARNSGVGLATLSTVLAIGAVVNLIAPILSERAGARSKGPLPLVLGYVGLGASLLFVTSGIGPAFFVAGVILLNLALLYLIPFLLGTASRVDASGRTASAAPAFFTIGGAIGPVLGGWVIGSAGLSALGIVLTAVACLALAIVLVVGRRAPSPTV